MDREKDKKQLLEAMKQYGYAEGIYWRRCGNCQRRFLGDKWAYTCSECACKWILEG
jgi:hypothetical protein